MEASLQNWPEEALGTQSSPHKARGNKVIKTGFVKSVRLSVPINEIVETYKKHCGVKFASQLDYRNSNRPMSVVKIEFLTEEDVQKNQLFLNTDLMVRQHILKKNGVLKLFATLIVIGLVISVELHNQMWNMCQ